MIAESFSGLIADQIDKRGDLLSAALKIIHSRTG